MTDRPSASITGAIGAVAGPALCGYVTGGYPTPHAFAEVFEAVTRASDLVEIGVPFTDPMADGLTVQRAGQAALKAGVSLHWILEFLQGQPSTVPVLLMGYYNPFLAFGLENFGGALSQSGVSGVIVPDLPFEESAPMRKALDPHGIALVQMVTPTTPEDRLSMLVKASEGFVYAVTMTGVTGGQVELAPAQISYLERVSHTSPLPVLAGFGVRDRRNVGALAPFVDGVVVGSALIDAIDNGDDPGEFLRSLRPVASGP